MTVIVWIHLIKGGGEMSYPVFNRDGKLVTLRNRVYERKILQDILLGEKTQKPLLQALG